MNIILLEKDEIIDNCAVLDDFRARHLGRVLGSRVGDTVRIGIIDGPSGYGCVREISVRQPYRVVLDIELGTEVAEPAMIDLMIALPRPIMLKRILSQATTLGVGSFYIVNSRKVEKSFWNSRLLINNGYRAHLLRGLEQAVDTRLPDVSFHKGFKPFIEKTVVQLGDRYQYMLVAHPGNGDLLKDVAFEKKGRILLAIGPEGGWTDYEIKKMQTAGFKEVQIGKRILRVDTAVIALHSMVSMMITGCRGG